MSYFVTVLLDNGRRQRVPCKPNTPILMILEETCKKHKLDSNKYDLKFHKRILDLTSTIQFCGIANNAQLELIPAVKPRTETPVTVFMQLENGQRLSGSFSSSSTLWQIIQELCDEETKSKNNPVIIYTRQEVFGEKLKSTTLKMFGLTGGNALLRLIHRTEDQLKNQSVSSIYKLPPKPKVIEETKPTRNVNKKDDHLQVETPIEVDASASSTHADLKFPVTVSVKNSFEDIPAGVKIVNPVPNDVEDTKKVTEDMEEVVSCSRQSKSSFKMTESENARKPALNINEIDYIGERYALLFRIDSAQSPRFNNLNEDDDFYELTLEDAKTLLRDVRRTRSELEGADLETAISKEKKKSILLERTLSLYPHCVVRILFPNRIVLQGVFESTETILDVIRFTKLFIDDSVLEFYLYTSPPKMILKAEQTLLAIGAIPGINLYFGGDQLNVQGDSFVKPQFMERMTSPSIALEVANHFRRSSDSRSRTETMNDETQLLPTSSSNENQTRAILHPTSQPHTSRTSTTGMKLPKWFKMK